MPELLLEVGCEELPATFVRRAYTELERSISNALSEAGIRESDGIAMGTPRRLIVVFSNVKARQEEQTKDQRGPSLKSAYSHDGSPTPALIGFCKAQGVDPASLRRDEQYVWLTKAIPGRHTGELLSEILPRAIRALSFEKSMRWGTAKMRFARPIRWILATFEGQVVPFEIEGVASSDQSRGHRFYSPGSFTAKSFESLAGGLRSRNVEPDPDVRRTRIVDQTHAVAQGAAYMPEALIDENVFLTEWPTAVQGEYRAEFMELPEPVLVTAMAKHEKMFPIRDPGTGKLTTRFVFVRNSGEDETVRRGATWVLNARFNDAKFFFDEDRKSTLADFLEKTGGILFQQKLGTVRQRAERLARLGTIISEQTIVDSADTAEPEFARQAGLYAKADLSTGLVTELASLQGIIGGEYARREGFADPVCWAISSQYDLAKNATATCSGGRTAVRLVIADQVDKLVGYLGLGLCPTGSSDPYGLRRAATLLIECAWLWPEKMPSFSGAIAAAHGLYNEQGVVLDASIAMAALRELFEGRYRAMMSDVRYDVLDAALPEPADLVDPQEIRFRVRCLERLAGDISFVQTATRPRNIVTAAKKNGERIGADLGDFSQIDLGGDDALHLLSILRTSRDKLQNAVEDHDVDEATAVLQLIAAPISAFFASTLVMDDEPRVRFARLTLLEAACQMLGLLGDFSKIVIEG